MNSRIETEGGKGRTVARIMNSSEKPYERYLTGLMNTYLRSLCSFTLMSWAGGDGQRVCERCDLYNILCLHKFKQVEPH